MEKQNQRTLAYILAQPIQPETTDTIYGGSASPSNFRGNQTLTATGNSAQGGDLNFDMSFDL